MIAIIHIIVLSDGSLLIKFATSIPCLQQLKFCTLRCAQYHRNANSQVPVAPMATKRWLMVFNWGEDSDSVTGTL